MPIITWLPDDGPFYQGRRWEALVGSECIGRIFRPLDSEPVRWRLFDDGIHGQMCDTECRTFKQAAIALITEYRRRYPTP